MVDISSALLESSHAGFSKSPLIFTSRSVGKKGTGGLQDVKLGYWASGRPSAYSSIAIWPIGLYSCCRKASLEGMMEERVRSSKASLHHIRDALRVFREAESLSRDRGAMQREAMETHSSCAMELLGERKKQDGEIAAKSDEATAGSFGLQMPDGRVTIEPARVTIEPVVQDPVGRLPSLRRYFALRARKYMPCVCATVQLN